MLSSSSSAAAHLGILAACVVLFVPMFLAGLHLSRNKMLFFSASLFISLALVVHLSPFLPSLFSSLPPPPPRSGSSAQLLVVPTPPPLPLSCLPSLPSLLRFLEPSRSSFFFARSGACDPKPLSPLDALLLLNGSSVAVAGDSQSRLLALSLLRLLILDPADIPPVSDALFRRHSDYRFQLPAHAFTLDFLWSPFESNISSFFSNLNNNNNNDNYNYSPDIIIAGSGLWHMLHLNNASEYGDNLAQIRETVRENDNMSWHLFWMGMPNLVVDMLNTEEKRERMNETVQEMYNSEVERSGILSKDGGPFLLLDVGALSKECGRRCTDDGMHYRKVVYDAAVQVLLNALLIQSRQRN